MGQGFHPSKVLSKIQSVFELGQWASVTYNGEEENRMHENIHRIIKRASRILLEAYHEGGADRENVILAWKKLNPGSSIAKRPWPATPLPLDVDGEETAAAARLVATATGMRLLGLVDIREGVQPGPQDLLFLRGLEGEDAELIEQGRQAGGKAGFVIDVCRREAPALNNKRQPRMGGQSSLF